MTRETDTRKRNEIDFSNSKVAFAHKSDGDLAFSVFIFRLMQYSWVVKLATKLTKVALKLNLPISGIVKQTVFRQFCGGETIEECENKAIVDLAKGNIGAILDYSVEGLKDEETFDHTAEELIRVIDKAKSSPHIPVSCMKITGIARFDLLERVSEGGELSKEDKEAFARVVRRVDKICKRANENKIPIYIDAEESWIQPAIDQLIASMMRKYNKEQAIVYTTFQMYKHSMLPVIERMIEEAKQEGFILGIKFVRGAYMEKEHKRAKKMGYRTPIQPDKESTDRDFDRGIKIAIQNLDYLEFSCGTHNELSCYKLVDLMDDMDIPHDHPSIYFAQLYGMSDNISFNLSNEGYNVTKYLPYGPVKSTIPYLTRRAEENSAISGQMGKELRFLLAERKRRKEEQKAKN